MDRKEKSKEKYDELFDSDAKKAAAFDKIAEMYYFNNFGSVSKTDLDTLLFSIYIDEILEKDESNLSAYSDYTLSKYLGITQSRISSLKVKKELKYPFQSFDWKQSFKRISENARYEGGKINLFIRDKNVYYEIKNAIEERGGYVDIQLNPTLLSVSPEYFIDLLLCISEEKDRAKIREKLKSELKEHEIDTEYLEKKSVGEILRQSKVKLGTDILCDIIKSCIPFAGPIVAYIMKNVLNEIIGQS